MNSFPMTHVEDIEISRLMVGTNWFLGYSHFSAAKSRWIKEYQTVERITEIMCVFARNGINAVMSIANETMKEAIRRTEIETGVKMVWVCTPSGEHLDDLMPNIDYTAEMGGAICMPHQHWTDGNLVVNEKRIIGLEKATERIRELGMIPGLSTHRPETVTVCEAAGYDIATYIQILNPIGFLCQVETDWVEKVIRTTPKPIMTIKPLAAGRVLPTTGLSYVYHAIKPIDTVCIGTLNVHEAEDDIAIARELLAAEAEACCDARALDYSRSKSALVREED